MRVLVDGAKQILGTILVKDGTPNLRKFPYWRMTFYTPTSMSLKPIHICSTVYLLGLHTLLVTKISLRVFREELSE